MFDNCLVDGETFLSRRRDGRLARSFSARSSEGLRTGVLGELDNASYEDLLLLLVLHGTDQYTGSEVGDDRDLLALGLDGIGELLYQVLCLAPDLLESF